MANLLVMLALTALISLQPDVQTALREAARLEQAGKTAAALETYRGALEAARPNTRDKATVLLGLAALESDIGRYPEAARHAREAAQVFRSLSDPVGLSNALNRGGLTLLYEGKYEEAGQGFRSALAVSRKAGDLEGQAEHLTNLANVHFYLSRYAEAADTYREALKITTAAASQAWAGRRRRLLLVNEATLYQRLGRDRDALAIYRDLGSAGELPPREQGQVLANLGVLYRRLGDPIKALETYDRARTLFARERHTDGELAVLRNRGIVLALDLNQLVGAEQAFTDALALAAGTGSQRQMLQARLYRAETRLRAGDRPGAREDFEAALALGRALETPEEEWKALFGLGRVERGDASLAHLHEAVTVIEQIRERIRVPSLRSDFLNDKREVYDELLAARLRQGTPGELFNLLERSHSRAWRERLALAGSVELSAIQHALPERVLLLDYWNAAVGSAVIVVSRERSAVLPLNVRPADIKVLIDTLSQRSSHWREPAAAVAAQVLPPERWFDNVDHVLIVPDGAVALVPFEVLPIGGRLLIVERAAVSYTPTAATLLRTAPEATGPRAPWHLQARAFADPVFGSAALDDAARLSGRLAASAREVHAVSRELGGRSLLHIGADDRKAYLRMPEPRAPILHLATHAIADTDAMEQSRLLFSPAEGGSGPADYLFLKEAYELPLQGVELAVLSACDTERGRLVRGEGVQSFSRAFLAAGARTAVTTLWRVADEPTADFMGIFYHHLQRGLPRDEALRLAKLRFLKSDSALSDPHFWASFVLTGDALRPIPRALAWRTVLIWAGASLAILVALLALVHFRRTAQAR